MGLIGKSELPVAIPTAASFPLFFALAQPDFFDWLSRWQTLVGAALALIGALITVRKIREQVDQTDRHEQQRLGRQHRASRATLPLTLSHICERLEALLLELHRVKGVLANKSYVSDFAAPLPSQDQIDALTVLISTTDDPRVGEHVAELIREIQTLWARCRLFDNRSEQKRNASLKDYTNLLMVQTATTYALAEALFDYARGKATKSPESVELSQAEGLVFRNHLEDDALKERFTVLAARSSSSWVAT